MGRRNATIPWCRQTSMRLQPSLSKDKKGNFVTTYLVTGGCGFIGSHLVDSLVLSGSHVRVLDDLSSGILKNLNGNAELIRGTVTDPRTVAEVMHDVDGCFHLAAIASVERGNLDWFGTHRVNQSGTINVLEAARSANREHKIPVVYASSAAVYGDVLSASVTEDTATRPISAYGADKLGSELHAYVAAKAHGVPTCGLRFFNVYGPRQDPKSPYSGVVSIFSNRLKAGLPIEVFGDGLQTRDFVYVADVVCALLGAMQHANPRGKVFNVCTGRATSVNDLIAHISTILQQAPQVRYAAARIGEIQSSLGDPSRAAAELGFSASIDIANGLTRLLDL